MTQAANLARVSDNIAHEVLWFCRNRFKGIAKTFHSYELAAHVSSMVQCSPDSPSRILRALRLAGRVDYVVVDRARSLYRVVGVRG